MDLDRLNPGGQLSSLVLPAPSTLSRRNLALVILLGAALLIELLIAAPRIVAAWHPYDYGRYVEMAQIARQGIGPNGFTCYCYPLPSVLWVFVPLSLLPDWFKLFWILVPLAALLFLFRRNGAWLFLFTPLWISSYIGMIEAWFLLPMAWLIQDQPVLAGLGAAVLLFKPQVAALTIGYMVAHWTLARNWRNLGAFVGAVAVLWLPAFLLDPAWPQHFMTMLPGRADENISGMPLLNSSIWVWWMIGGFGRIVFAVLIFATVVLFWRVFRCGALRERASAVQSLNLLLVFVLFAASTVTLLPTLRGRSEIVAIVLVSLGAFVLDHLMGGFGGGYAFIPLAALYLQTKREVVPMPASGGVVAE